MMNNEPTTQPAAAGEQITSLRPEIYKLMLPLKRDDYLSGTPAGEAEARQFYDVYQSVADLVEKRMDGLQSQLAAAEAERDWLHMTAIGALTQAGICTPAEGYLKARHCLSANIEELAKQRDTARARIAALEAENQNLKLALEEANKGWDRASITLASAALTATAAPPATPEIASAGHPPNCPDPQEYQVGKLIGCRTCGYVVGSTDTRTLAEKVAAIRKFHEESEKTELIIGATPAAAQVGGEKAVDEDDDDPNAEYGTFGMEGWKD